MEHPDAARPGPVAQGEPAPALGGEGVDLQVHDLGDLKELVLGGGKYIQSRPLICSGSGVHLNCPVLRKLFWELHRRASEQGRSTTPKTNSSERDYSSGRLTLYLLGCRWWLRRIDVSLDVS